MPVNTELLQGMIDSAVNSRGFNILDPVQQGGAINSVIEDFQTQHASSTKEDTDEINKIANDTFSKYKIKNNENRFAIPPDQFSQFGPSLNINPQDTKDAKIKGIEDWESDYTKQASALLPANSDDIKNQVSAIADDEIRKAASDGDWRAHDLINRTLGGAVKPLFDLFGQTRWFDSSWMGRTNPEYDSDLSSQVFSGIGTIASLAAIGAATGGIGDAIGIGTELGATLGNLGYFNATMMHDSYKQELSRSGDPDKAWGNALAQIPGASIQAIGDMFIMRMGLGELIPDVKGFKNEWLAASTNEAKQAILQKAIPTIGREAIRGGLIGATGMIAQDTLSGLGSYYATGDEAYLKPLEETLKSGAVGGILGAITGAAFTGHAQDVNRERVGRALTDVSNNQKAIYDLLQKGDYQGVHDLYTNNFITPETTPEYNQAQGAPAPTVQKARAYDLGNGVQFSSADVHALINLKEPSVDDENYSSLKADYDRKKTALSQIQDGSLPLKTQSVFSVPEDAGGLGASVGPHDITLADGSKLQDQVDPSHKVVYVNDPNLANKFTSMGVQFGEISLVDIGEGKATPVVKTPDGNIKVGDKGSQVSISNTAKEGWTPVVVDDKTSSGTIKDNNSSNIITNKDAEQFRTTAGIQADKFADHVVDKVDKALKNGDKVTLIADGGKKEVPITSVSRGMMQDEHGQRWGTLSLLTDSREGVKIESKSKDESLSENTQRSLKILPAVKAVDSFIEQQDYTHVQTINKKNGDPKSVIAQDKNGNKVTVPAETPLGKQLIKQRQDQVDELKRQSEIGKNATQVEGIEPAKETLGTRALPDKPTSKPVEDVISKMFKDIEEHKKQKNITVSGGPKKETLGITSPARESGMAIDRLLNEKASADKAESEQKSHSDNIDLLHEELLRKREEEFRQSDQGAELLRTQLVATEAALEAVERDVAGKPVSEITPEQFSRRVEQKIRAQEKANKPKSEFGDFVKKNITEDTGLSDKAKSKWTQETYDAAQRYFESGSVRELDDITSIQRAKVEDMYDKFGGRYEPKDEEVSGAGFKNESDARAAYEKKAIITETYKEFLTRRACS